MATKYVERAGFGEAPTIATVFAFCRIRRRSLAHGPTQVRFDFSSFASGELAGMSQVRPFDR